MRGERICRHIEFIKLIFLGVLYLFNLFSTDIKIIIFKFFFVPSTEKGILEIFEHLGLCEDLNSHLSGLFEFQSSCFKRFSIC